VRHSRQANRDLNLRRACFQVGSNLLTSLPAEIGQLTKVEVLYVRVSN
jgi:hypothetical protein